LTYEDVRALVRARMSEFSGTGAAGPRGTGLRGWCEDVGLPSGHVSEFLNGKRGPPTGLLEVLGLEWTIRRKDVR
jgi:hypothetical protein